MCFPTIWVVQRTVPIPIAECVMKRATNEENSSGEEAPAAMRVAPEFHRMSAFMVQEEEIETL